ncbi:MAG TPA: hypothetical protein VJM08_18875, partial [Anaerolineales bacterium]|nr:hypothetical protein [Anaerolineales bacterium]
MKKQTTLLLIATLFFSLFCQFLMPSARDGTIIANCANVVSTVGGLQSGDIPQHLLDTGRKNGNEFDVNQYFTVLPHLSMHDGYVLDYVYINDSLGGFPLLYARPESQAPYTSMKDVPANLQRSDFREYLEVEDVEQGYFEYLVLSMMANQFYLDWHANYNDTQIVCTRRDVNAIVESASSGGFGVEMDRAQQAKARAMKDIEPAVQLTENTAFVEVITFTKWGGFYRQTYTISRSFPHTIIATKEENLVPYDCGI